MKKILLLIALMACITAAKAQLAKTEWSGVMSIPNETEVLLKFSTDTVQIIVKDVNYVGETMLYSVKDGVITLKKTDGNSPCNNDPFTVSYTIKDNKLSIKTLVDHCDDRANMWPANPFEKTTYK